MTSSLHTCFIDVLNMSMTAAYAILLILPIRLLFKKSPKIFSFSLWLIVYLRLLLPFSFSSPFSFLRGNTSAGKMQYIPSNITMMAQPEISSNISSIDTSLNAIMPAATPDASANPMQVIFQILSIIWLTGIIVMLLRGLIAYIKLTTTTSNALLIKENIYESNQITTPFVLGIFRPKIYLPAGTQPHERALYIKHEQIHIRRFDHVTKQLAYGINCIHWFNPLVWLAFHLMSKDMEMSCDEQVLNELGPEIKHDYCTGLLTLATGNHIKKARIPAFGESNVKTRVRNILSYRKPSLWPVIAALAVFAVVLTGLMSNPLEIVPDNQDYSRDIYSYRTPYVGNNSSVVNIVDRLPVPPDFSRSMVQLYTSEQPYAVEITYQTTPERMDYFSQTEHQAIFDHNAILMFALIGNTENVRFLLSAADETLTIERNRDWANETMQQDVWEQSGEYESFARLNQETNKKYPAAMILTELLNSGKRTGRQSTNDVPSVSDFIRLEVSGETYFIYRRSGRYYVEKPYQFIDEISREAWLYIRALAFPVEELSSSHPSILRKPGNIM